MAHALEEHRVMRRTHAPRALGVAAVSIALACTAQTAAPGPSSAPPTAMVRSAPSELIARIRDLPAGYRLEDDQAVTLEFLSGGDDRAIARDQSLRAGFVSGHTRTFGLDADAANGDRLAYLYLYEFNDPDAASTALERSVPRDPSYKRVAVGETIGDNSHGYRFVGTASNGGNVEVQMIHFQYGNTVSYVLVQGPPSAPTMNEATVIAHSQLARLQTDAAGLPQATPSPRAGPVTSLFSELGVRSGDLPAGFRVTDDLGVDIGNLADDDLKEDFWREIGFRTGWARAFESADGVVTIYSVVLLCSPTKVERALDQIVRSVVVGSSLYQISLGAAIGDESFGAEGRGVDQGRPITYRSVHFRFGDAVGWIIVQSPTGAYEASFLTDLAKKLIARLT
jgi:hypothetical protein